MNLERAQSVSRQTHEVDLIIETKDEIRCYNVKSETWSNTDDPNDTLGTLRRVCERLRVDNPGKHVMYHVLRVGGKVAHSAWEMEGFITKDVNEFVRDELADDTIDVEHESRENVERARSVSVARRIKEIDSKDHDYEWERRVYSLIGVRLLDEAAL